MSAFILPVEEKEKKRGLMRVLIVGAGLRASTEKAPLSKYFGLKRDHLKALLFKRRWCVCVFLSGLSVSVIVLLLLFLESRSNETIRHRLQHPGPSINCGRLAGGGLGASSWRVLDNRCHGAIPVGQS